MTKKRTPITNAIRDNCTTPARKLKEKAIKAGNNSEAMMAGAKEAACKVLEEGTKISTTKKKG